MKAKLLVAIMALMTVFSANAQNFKIGYTNVDAVLVEMPKFKDIQDQLGIKQKQYEKLIQEKKADYDAKVKEFQANEKVWSDVIKADKVKFIQNLEQSIQEFGQNAQQDMQKKQGELLQPLLTEIQNSIDVVAKDLGYAYILNTAADASSTPLLLHADPQYDITESIFKKLNITPKAKGTPVAAPQPAPTPKKN
jgi:outer membrane protein